MQPHVVYLALAGGPKVGITRDGREHQRWTDQGAHEAIRIVRTPTRRSAGIVEAHLARYVADKSDWRQVVRGVQKSVDLFELARQLRRQLPDMKALETDMPIGDEIDAVTWNVDDTVTRIRHPVQAYSPPKRLVLDESAQLIRDRFEGVLGHFLLLKRGVFDIWAHRGMGIDVTFSSDSLDEEDEGQLSLI